MTASLPPVYRHCRLPSPNSIRILNLQPSADFHSVLSIGLVEVSLDSLSHDYEALSYVWGSRKGSQPLECDGSTILVTPNCESALRHLRRKSESRILWVDALCIDQGDDEPALTERSVQVSLMGEIYSKAVRTLCWLGEGLQFSAQVMSHVEKIGECPSKRGLEKLMHFERHLQQKSIINIEESCLDHIFSHSWHSRIWTTQEVAFSRNCQVLCGHSSISWETYSAAAQFLIFDEFLDTLDLQASKSLVSIDMRNVLRDYLSREQVPAMPASPAPDLEDTIEERDRQATFLSSCLTDVNQLQATDPRDKIYGLYAVFTQLGISLPAVSYTKSVSEVYTEAALAMISWSGSLKILRDACSTTRDQDLPSWVPDWNDAEVRLYMPDAEATDCSLVHSTDVAALSPIRGKLRTKGRVIGHVLEERNDTCIIPFPTRSDLCDLPVLSTDATYRGLSDVGFLRLLVGKIKFFRDSLQCLQKRPRLCNGNEPSDTLYDLATLGGRCANADSFDTFIDTLTYPNTQYDLSEGFALAADWKTSDTTDPAQWTSELTTCTAIAAALVTGSIKLDGERLESHTELLELFKELSSNLADQAVITVQLMADSHARMGTTFQSVAPEDRVLLLEGADWPVVLRPEGEEWTLIGPAYVMGIMNGEAWNSDDEDLEDFMLV